MDENKFLSLIKRGICENWERPALTNYNGSTYLYKDLAHKIAEIHLLFDALQLQKGDKVVLCGRNAAHWAIAFFASLSYGAVVATALHDFNGEGIHSIVNHSDAKVLFADEFVWSKIDPVQIAAVETIFMLEEFTVQKSRSPKLFETRSDWERLFLNKYPNGFSPSDVKFHNEGAEELAILNYTSGTTSKPKGVMLPYRSIWSNTQIAIDQAPFLSSGDGMVCILPMAHMFGLLLELLLPIAKGCHIHYLTRVPSPQIIVEALSRVNPPLVILVPLIIEKIIQNRVFPQLKKQPVKTLVKIPFLKKKIYKKIYAKLIPIFGNKLHEIAIGGASLNKEVNTFLKEIKFPYTVGYGMTECGPLISYNDWTEYKSGSCGRAVDRMEVRIESANPSSEIGEIITRGANMMLGYYKNEEATKAILSEDGWMRTGDLGIIDKEGYVFIKGRSKTMILDASGQNIFPEEIEDYYNNSPYIAETLIIEEKGKLIALIYPNKEYLEEEGIKEDGYTPVFVEEMKSINKRLANYSQVTTFRLQNEEFEKTPKRSIKRFLYQH